MARMARMARPERLVGRRFEHNGVVWEVGRISSVSNTVPHVELFKVHDPIERKTISVSALLEGNDFVQIDERR